MQDQLAALDFEFIAIGRGRRSREANHRELLRSRAGTFLLCRLFHRRARGNAHDATLPHLF
jgi:hypothetical protein